MEHMVEFLLSITEPKRVAKSIFGDRDHPKSPIQNPQYEDSIDRYRS